MSHLHLHVGLQNALSVLSELKHYLSQISSESYSIESFDNCREQGLVLIVSDPNIHYIAITNDRHTDQIKVISYREASFPFNMIKEGSTDSEITFTNSKSAADHIKGLIDQFECHEFFSQAVN